jgi:hypothetical protein
MPAFPVTEQKLYSFVAYTHDTRDIKGATLSSYVDGICHVAKLTGGLQDKHVTGVLKLVIDGCKTIDYEKGKFITPPSPITIQMLSQLIDSLDLTDAREAMFASYCLNSFIGGFRVSELIVAPKTGIRCSWDMLHRCFKPSGKFSHYKIL